jgi:platelet-activating factor acetylhydrolase IB subunit alpha
MVLTEGERGNMHAAVVEYLSRRCGAEVAEDVARRLAASLGEEQSEAETALERRWATLVRLAERNRELEARLKAAPSAESSVRTALPGQASTGSSAGRLPCSTPAATLTGHRDTLTSVAFCSGDSFLFSGSEDGTVRMWDVDRQELVRVIRGHVGNVSCIAIEPQHERHLATCSDDCTVRIIDLTNFSASSLVGTDVLCACCWLRDGSASSLLTGSRSGELRLWNVAQATVRWSLQLKSSILCISVPPYESTFFAACGKDEAVHFYDATQKKEVQTLRVHDNAVTALSFCGCAMEVMICETLCATEEAKCYGRELKRKMTGGESATPRFILSGSRDKSVALTDLTTGLLVLRFSDHQNWVRGLAVSPDCVHVISVSDDGCCNVYSVSAKRRVKTINAHEHFVTCVGLRRAGPLMVTGSADTTLRIWRFVD